jgi:large subunit ribosomal protein L13
MGTYNAKKGSFTRKWYVVDAEGMVLGRFASEIARILRGKHKPIYTPHVDTGDHVVVVNADKIVVTGRKADQKEYVWHTGYPGGLRRIGYTKLQNEKPERIVERAILGMLPHNRLGNQMGKKLKVYAGPNHRHVAQRPEILKIGK